MADIVRRAAGERAAVDCEDLRRQAVQLRSEGRSRREIGDLLNLGSDSAVGRLLVGTAPLPALRRSRAKDDQRARARELRAQGWTYRQIAAELGVSTSSCSLWLRDMPHPIFERHRADGRWHASWAPALRRREAARQQRKLDAAREVLPLSRRDILLAGAVAYWCEGSKDKKWRRHEYVRFVNSDQRLIRLFLAFLDVVGVSSQRRGFRVSIHETADAQAAVAYWADVAGVRPEDFARTTVKRHRPITNRRNTGEDYHGCLVVSVSDGADLYRRIEGWCTALSLGLPAEPGSVRLGSDTGPRSRVV